MEGPGLDDLIILGLGFFPALLGIRVAALAAAALRSIGHGFVAVRVAGASLAAYCLRQLCALSRLGAGFHCAAIKNGDAALLAC